MNLATNLHLDDILINLLVLLIVFGIPGILTVWNIYNCCAGQPKKEKLIATLTVFIGGVFYFIFRALRFEEAGDWQKQIYTTQIHNSFSSEYNWFAICVVVCGLIGLFTLLYIDANKLPPLISATAVALLVVFNVFHLAYAIQLAKNIISGTDFLLYVYHANLLLLSACVLRKQIMQQLNSIKDQDELTHEHKAFMWIHAKMTSLTSYSFLIVVCLFFFIAILEIVFVIMGQGLDAPIKAFTDTADWTFSKQIPPPPIDYPGHYLCTVAAGGHKKIVKPLRLGTRRGAIIVVNRQLCIANAFEELICERFPRLHQAIRDFYDTYGYPVSKYITSPIRADVIYILMKPMEWFFLIALYMLDLHPERRISRQYMKSPQNVQV